MTHRGGLPEVIGNAGFRVDFPPACYEQPYTSIPRDGLLERLVERIESLYDDEALYQRFVTLALAQGRQHCIETRTDHLMEVLAPLVLKRAGDHAGSRVPGKNKQQT